MIRDVIQKQKTELEEKLREKYIRRETLLNTDDSGLIKVIIGPRRAGKSFFGMHAVAGSGSFGFVNFDDERLVTVSETIYRFCLMQFYSRIL